MSSYSNAVYRRRVRRENRAWAEWAQGSVKAVPAENVPGPLGDGIDTSSNVWIWPLHAAQAAAYQHLSEAIRKPRAKRTKRLLRVGGRMVRRKW